MFFSKAFSLMRFAILTLIVTGVLVLPWWIMSQRYGPRIQLPHVKLRRPIAIVFGAGLRRDGRPTRVLSDRVRTAVELYEAGKVGKLLLSGSAEGTSYDEPQAMARLALELGVAEEDLLLDRGGSRTYSTCARAVSVFGVQQALLVSQRFHLPRALAICDSMGIDALGIPADGSHYSRVGRVFWHLREIPASIVALWDMLTIPKTASASTLDADGIEKDRPFNGT